jgi:putative ABC transport system permease protein
MIRIAFKILLHDTAKYVALVLGIAFATLLISQQAAIFHSVVESSARDILDASEANVWVTKLSVETVDQPDPLPELAVHRVRSVSEIEWAVPYYQAMAPLRTPDGGSKLVTLIGVDDSSLVAAPKTMLIGSLDDLRRPDAVVLDAAGFAVLFPGIAPRVGDVVEIGQRRAEIVGISYTGASWSGLPRVHTRRSLAVDMAREASGLVTYVLARAVDGVSPDAAARAVERSTGLQALSRDDFKTKTQRWMLEYSGVAENFGITILMGVVIGIAIVGQTFYLFSIDNAKQFAALKAIGIGNRTIVSMITTQALFVSIVGYGVGIGAASAFLALYSPQLTGGLRGMFMDPRIFVGSGVFIVFVTLGSCFVSVRRVLTADPVEVFRS